MEYKIIHGDNEFVTRRVNEELKEGWELYGPPSMITYDIRRQSYSVEVRLTHSQAMVKGATAWQVRK